MKISIAIPAFDDGEGQGALHLRYQFDNFISQTHTDFDVVISDHSDSSNIKDICEEYNDKLDIKYLKYTEDLGYWGSNLNIAMRNCDGDIIKTMLLDDFLLQDTSLETIDKLFSLNDPQWVMCGGIHTHNYTTFYDPVVTNAVFRDIGAWMQLVFIFDTTQGTAGDRIKIYHNGTQISSFSS